MQTQIKLPAIIVNFKTYESATGDMALKLAKIHEKVSQETGVTIGICVQPTDIKIISIAVKIPVFAQHIDCIEFGAHTGHILPESVKQSGAFGTLLNHSEHKIPLDVLQNYVERAKNAGLFTIVCAETPQIANQISKFSPDLIAVEPPELIGGNISVSKAKPDVITDSLNAVGSNKLLVGAGIKDSEDVRIAVQLGSVGILVASGVVQANNPEEALLNLAKGIM